MTKDNELTGQKFSIEECFQSLQDVIQLLTQKAQFRDHLTEALRIICKCLDADNALFIETIPTLEKNTEFHLHRIFTIPAIGNSREYDTPTALLEKAFNNQEALSWANELSNIQSSSSSSKKNNNTLDEEITKKLNEHEVINAVLKAVSIDFSSFLLFPLSQEHLFKGFLFFSSTDNIIKTPKAISLVNSCIQILSTLLANQQTESLRLIKQDFLQQKKEQLPSLITDDNNEILIGTDQDEEANLTSYIASTIPDHIFLVDIEKGKAVFSNTDIFLGYNIATEKDPLEIFATIIHPDDQAAAIMEFILKLKDAKDGEVVSSEYRMRHKNGQWIWIRERAKVFKRFPDGVVRQYVAVMQDVTEKKEALIRISNSEQRYRNFIKYSTEGIFYMNCGKPIPIHLSPEEQTNLYYQTAFIQECNLALAKMYDYNTETQLEGQKVKDIHLRESYKANKKSFQHFIENNYHVEEAETVEMLDDGSIKYFLNRRLGIIEKDHLIGIWGVQQDITAKRIAEMALQESEIRLSEVVKDAKLGLWEFTPSKDLIILNEICLNFLGREKNTIGFSELSELIHPEDAGKLNSSPQVNLRLLSHTGEWKWVQIHGNKVNPLDDKQATRFFGTVIDIHKQKTAELLIKESAELLKAILNTLPDTKLRINYEGKILAVFASSKTPTSENLSTKDQLGKDLKEILPLFVAKGLLFNARKALDTQALQTFEFIESKDKKIQYFEARINSINFEEAIIILRNITPLKIAEKALNDQIKKYDREKRELEKYIDSNLQLENFAYIASHDLREPLRTMRTFGQFLDQKIGKDLDKDSRSYLDFIINSANRMNQLIEDLLTYSRVDTDPLTRESIDTEKLLISITDGLRMRIDETQAKIIVENIPEVIYGSTVRVQQVFQNLIANAIKFHQKDVSPIVIISSKETPTHWEFSIQDNGIGIKEEFFDRIFAIFKKLHGHQVYHGTGIGLALVKRIISQHGGEVWLESQINEGTTFHFTLLK